MTALVRRPEAEAQSEAQMPNQSEYFEQNGNWWKLTLTVLLSMNIVVVFGIMTLLILLKAD